MFFQARENPAQQSDNSDCYWLKKTYDTEESLSTWGSSGIVLTISGRPSRHSLRRAEWTLLQLQTWWGMPTPEWSKLFTQEGEKKAWWNTLPRLRRETPDFDCFLDCLTAWKNYTPPGIFRDQIKSFLIVFLIICEKSVNRSEKRWWKNNKKARPTIPPKEKRSALQWSKN